MTAKPITWPCVRALSRLLCVFAAGCLPAAVGAPAVLQAQTAPATESDTIIQSLDNLTLDQAIAIALQESNSVWVNDAQYIKATYAEREQWASLFPSVSISGNYSATLKKQVMYLDGFPGAGSMGGDASKGIEMGRTHNIQTGVVASMPLVNASLWESIALSKEQVLMGQAQAQASMQDLVAQVTKAFYSALLAGESVSVLRESYTNAQENYQSVKQKYDQGLVAQYDLLRAESSLNSLEPTLLQAETAHALTIKNLLILIGLSPYIPTTISGDLDQLVASAPINPERNLDNNPTLKILERQGALAEGALKMTRYAFIPTLALQGNYNFNFSSNQFDLDNSKLWTPYSAVALSLQIPLFTGTKRIHTMRKAQADVLIYQLQVDDTRRQLTLAQEQQLDQIKVSAKKIEVSRRAIETARQGYVIAVKRYDTGMGTQLEVNDANVQLLQANLTLKQAQNELLQAVTQMQLLRGDLLPEMTPEQTQDRLKKVEDALKQF